jgi:hypothetical protein
VGKVNFQDVEYTCRSLSDLEMKQWADVLKENARTKYWRPAQNYWQKLEGLPEATKNHCLAVYLAQLDWNEPPREILRYSVDLDMVAWLLKRMIPEFPATLNTQENRDSILKFLEPYFIMEVSRG